MNTPRYEFSKSRIIENYESMSKKLPLCRLFYAMKANGNKEVLKILKEAGASFEVASIYEFDIVREVGVDPSEVVFGLPVKTEDTIKYTYENGCRYYVFDDIRELHKIQKYAPDARKILRMQVSDLIPSSIIYGMPIGEIEENIDELMSSIDGISFHISYNRIIEAVEDVCSRLDKVLSLLEAKDKNYVINIGGGYEDGVDDEFYKKYNKLLNGIKEKYKCTFYAEPGKTLVDTAGAFYAKVIAKKSVDNKVIIYMDGGLANGIGYNAFTGYVENCNGNTKSLNSTRYEFRDCTNLNETLIRLDSCIDIQVGDEIKFGNFGAYSIVFQNSFHKWPKCVVEIVD